MKKNYPADIADYLADGAEFSERVCDICGQISGHLREMLNRIVAVQECDARKAE